MSEELTPSDRKFVAQRVEGLKSMDLDIDRYDSTPLPFESIGEPENLTWKDFDQDETGKFVYLYRGLDNTDKEYARETAHQSKAASSNEKTEEIFKRYKTDKIIDIARLATERIQGSSPILHTTRDKKLAGRLAHDGVLITYKIPKGWIVDKNNRPITGNIGEKELDFFYQIPKEFLEEIKQFGEDKEIIQYQTPSPQGKNDLINSETLPSPPSEIQIIP